MLPSWKLVHPRWEGNDENCFFVHDVEDVICLQKPALWLFGHTHDCVDKTLYETRCVCAPRGYSYESAVMWPKERYPKGYEGVILEV
jgi:hypothetical protein